MAVIDISTWPSEYIPAWATHRRDNIQFEWQEQPHQVQWRRWECIIDSRVHWRTYGPYS